MKRFSIGDAAWIADCGRHEVNKPCPVCFGKKRVTVIFGDDTEVSLECDYCKQGFDGPFGYITEYEWLANVRSVTIQKVTEEITASGTVYEYGFAGSYSMKGETVFETKDEALALAEKQAEEHNRELGKKASSAKYKQSRSYSWNAGYHRSEIKREQRSIEYHERCAAICKAHAKAEKKAPQ